MKKLLCTAIALILVVSFARAESPSGLTVPPMASIWVDGKGQVKAIPEIMNFNLSLKVSDKDYTLCSQKTLYAMEEAVRQLVEAGVDKNLISNEGLNVTKNVDFSCEDKVKTEDLFDGRITVCVKCKFDAKIVSKVYDASMMIKNIKDFSINYSFSDEQMSKLKQQALDLAVKNAIENAQILATSSGVQLGNIQFINSSTNPRESDYERYNQEKTIDFSPKEKSLSRSVQILYNIKYSNK